MYTIHCIQYNVYNTKYTKLCTQYYVQCTKYNVYRGEGMGIFENSPRKWPNSHSRKLFLNLFEEWQNSILSRYSAITLHNIHLNAKSHNLLLEPSSRKYNLQSPMHH